MLSQQMPQKGKELDRLLVKYLGDMEAQMAKPNPNYDPAKNPVSRKGAKAQREEQRRNK
ncbi:MAG: hypothetical protein R3C20_23470 [Planctomycetaceae bacterium]